MGQPRYRGPIETVEQAMHPILSITCQRCSGSRRMVACSSVICARMPGDEAARSRRRILVPRLQSESASGDDGGGEVVIKAIRSCNTTTF